MLRCTCLLVALLLAAGLVVVDAAPPATQSAATQPALVDLTLPPIATFEASCARCHGPEGSFYGEAFADLSPRELRHVVEDMMRGPAGLAPTDADLDAMVAYHRALRAKQPFVAVINARSWRGGEDAVLQGEAPPGAEVRIERGDVQHIPDRAAAAWSLDLRAADEPSLRISAERDEKHRTQFDFPAQQWSHHQPR